MPNMFDNGGVYITVERFEELIRAEHELNALKAMLTKKWDEYSNIPREEIRMLMTLFFPGEKAE